MKSTPLHVDNLNSSSRLLREIDWNFPDLGNKGIHSLHWYPATFVSAIPGSLIPLLSELDDLVVDPFCGACATGVEAIRLGRRFVGVDTNPVATLIASAKLLLPSRAGLLDELGGERLASIFLENDRASVRSHPNEEELLRWYHPTTYRELCFLLSTIAKINDPKLRIPAQALFSSILKTVSSQARHWGWVCDNVVPKPDEIVYKDALEAFRRALAEYVSSVDDLVGEMRVRKVDWIPEVVRTRWEITCSDAVGRMSSMESGSAGLILTSPPYYGVADYVKSQRLSFLWLAEEYLTLEGYVSKDFERLRQREVGSRSFRRRADSFSSYVSYMGLFFSSAYSLLKPGGYLALVIGDSDARESTSEAIDRESDALGFRKVFSIERDIRGTRRRMRAKVKKERIIILSK